MPELPEVETTRRGLAPHVLGKTLTHVTQRHKQLRWPIPPLHDLLAQQSICTLQRRGKYLIFGFHHGDMIMHLGMSGSARIIAQATPAQRHDHIDWVFNNGLCMRYTDPRRFGAILWQPSHSGQHPLLQKLGPEPLSAAFNAHHLKTIAKRRRIAIKPLIMDNHVVVGVGNIYANEALFMAGIHPARPASRISMQRYNALCMAIQKVLRKAIKAGGTTLKDFTKTDGTPGRFHQSLSVYGRSGLPCLRCQLPLKNVFLQQRNTVYCSNCQH